MLNHDRVTNLSYFRNTRLSNRLTSLLGSVWQLDTLHRSWARSHTQNQWKQRI